MWSAGVAFALIGTAASAHHAMPRVSAAANPWTPAESIAVSASETSQEVAPPAPDERLNHPVPVVNDQPLDELYPSLLDWIHPVVGADEILPTTSGGRFGAGRQGIDRAECGEGHCGVDLAGPIGRPVVSVSDGIVIRIERSEMGRDGRSGRYVRIEHPDGTLTAYMHLDSIAEGLQVGDHVDGGQQIGTLGATAVHVAGPHLHFALEVPNHYGALGEDTTDTKYVDPAPFLVRATVHPLPDRRPGKKPAF